IQKKICAYVGGKFCDCKYSKDLSDSKPFGYGEENSGCPECRAIRYFVSNMTDAEFKRIAKRIQTNEAKAEQKRQVNYLKNQLKVASGKTVRAKKISATGA